MLNKEPIYWDSSGQSVKDDVCELLGWINSKGKLTAEGKRISHQLWEDLKPVERRKLEEHGIMPFPYKINQKFNFTVGDKVICNNHLGYVRVVCTGKLEGMVEVALDRGTACVSASYPDCYPI